MIESWLVSATREKERRRERAEEKRDRKGETKKNKDRGRERKKQREREKVREKETKKKVRSKKGNKLFDTEALNLYGARCSSMVRAFCSWCDGSSDRSFVVDPLSYFSFQPVLHNYFNKGRSMCCPVCRMMHMKEPLLLIGKSSPCGCSGFTLSLSEWSFTICLTPYNRK